MGTNTGLGIGIGIPFKNFSSGGRQPLPPDLKASLKGVWIAYGKSNNDADRSIVKNLVDLDNPFVISNAVFKLNSGYGKYEQDFTDWKKSFKVTSFDSESIKFTSDVSFVLLYHPSSIGEDIPSFKVRIKLYGEGTLYYNYINQEGTYTNVAVKSEIFETPICYNTKYIGEKGVNVGFTIGVRSGECSGTITQIPSFQGAFVTDGINDLITSTKSATEMLDGSNEVTVVSMIHQIKTNDDTTRNNWFFTPVSYLENRVVENKTGKTGIYGYTSTNVTNAQISDITPILGDKNDYTLYSKIEDGDRDYFTVEGFQNQGIWYVSSIAWYWTIIANKVLTTDQINQVIAYFNLDRCVEPTVLYDVKRQGLSNDTPDSDWYLKDFSKNGFDMSLFNFAKKGNSGVGKYNFSSINVLLNRFEGTLTSNKCHFTKKLTSTTNNFCDVQVISPNEPIKFKVSGLSDGRKLFFLNKDGSGSNYHFDNGEHEVSLSFSEGAGQNNPFGVTGDIGDIDVTVEFIPSHAGALCLDGVNDFGQFVGDLGLKDYTLIMNRAYNNLINNQVPLISSNIVEDQTPFIVEHWNTGSNAISFSYGASRTTNIPLDINKKIVYQSTYSYMGYVIPKGNAISTGNGITLGKFGNGVQYSAICLWSLMLFPYSMSEFLIERQLKKHKLGTLYPDMVEFRPVIKTNTEWEYLEIYQGDNRLYNLSEHDDKTGIYLEENSSIEIYVKPYTGQKVSKIVYNGTSYIDLENNGYGYYYITVPVTKSPQKIGITIEWDENYVQWNPVVESNVAYKSIRYYKLGDSGSGWIGINIGDYIPIGRMIMITIDTANTVDELVSAVSSQLTGIGINGSNGTYNITGTLTSESPQNINITIDEYIRYEDIAQPYPVLLRFKDENGNEVSWGGKFRVGSTITRIGSIADPESNLLNGLYSVSGLSLNGKAVTSSTSIVEKQMVFRTTATWLLDNNEPKVILSPSRLRIPNSSYKLLGYIPDISGHGNHGVIHNSAYAEGSGVNEDGSYQLDGVDDFVTIPTVTGGGKQVLMKVNNNTINSILYDQRSSGASPNSLNNDFAIHITDTDNNNLIAYQSRLVGNTYIDGILNTNITCEDLLGVLHNITITCDIVAPNNGVVPNIGRGGVLKDLYSKVALYDFMLFDNISTGDKIKELNEYVGIEAKVELPPYYWDAYGKTNLDADKATIQQRGVAVGDYDLTNTNFAYDKMSGFGGYEFEKFTDTTKWIETKREDGIEVIEKNDYSFTAKKVGTGQYFWDFKNNTIKTLDRDLTVKAISNNNVYIRWEFKYRTAEKPDKDSTIILLMKAMTPNVPITVTLPYKTQEEQTELGVVEGSTYYLFYFDPSDIPVGDEYTVEMLPLYTNGLVYDGVTDYSENANIPALDDFTAIIKREWLKKQGCPLIKGSKVYEGGNGNALLLEWDKAYNFVFYKRTDIMEGELPDNISFITPTNYNGNVITRGSEQDTNGICIAGDGNAGFANMVFYKLILYPKTIPLLQINFLKNMMERDEIIDLNNKIFIKNE